MLYNKVSLCLFGQCPAQQVSQYHPWDEFPIFVQFWKGWECQYIVAWQNSGPFSVFKLFLKLTQNVRCSVGSCFLVITMIFSNQDQSCVWDAAGKITQDCQKAETKRSSHTSWPKFFAPEGIFLSVAFLQIITTQPGKVLKQSFTDSIMWTVLCSLRQ